METVFDISPPRSEEDTEGARHVFEQFLTLHKPTLERVEHYLEDIIDNREPMYGVAYRPWCDALHNLIRGAYLMSRKIPLPDKEGFIEALQIFSLGSAIQFLRDVCTSCHVSLPRDWAENFRKHIDLLLFSFSIMHRQQQAALSL